MPLTDRGHERQRAAPLIGDQMDLGRQPSTGVSQRFPISRLGLLQFQIRGRSGPVGQILVIRCSPLWIAPPPSTGNRPRPPQAGQRERRQARRGEHQQRGGVRGRRWSRLRATTPPRRHSHAGVLPTPPPRCRRQTNADAGCRRSSTTRRRPGDPSTATLSGSATTPRRPPFGDPSTDAHAAAPDQAATAPTQPTQHRSGHGDHAHRPAYRNPPRNLYGTRPSRVCSAMSSPAWHSWDTGRACGRDRRRAAAGTSARRWECQ